MIGAPQASTNSRRLFFAAGAESFQLVSFSQAADASIYISAPGLGESKWLEVVAGAPPSMRITALPNAGKLSIHGSGVSHVGAADGGETELRLVGNYLLNNAEQRAGVRHLLTMFPTKPTHLPGSIAGARQADCTVEAQESKPYVLIFWAVPAITKLTVNIGASFQADDLENVPPESGFGAFALRIHTVVWFAYRTKHMSRWPAESHLCFHDGYHVPVLIGTGVGACRLELRSPKLHLFDNRLKITI